MRNLILSLFLFFWTAGYAMEKIFVVHESRYSPEKTTVIIISSLKNYGLQLFNVVDHHINAQQAGFRMDFERVVVFGNPVVGTKLMKENPLIGLELPLKILIYRKNGKTFVAYKNPFFVEKVYNLGNMHQVFARMNGILKQITSKVIRETQ
ncbi:DUF302 domain-containing protein [Persephonella sp.]